MGNETVKDVATCKLLVHYILFSLDVLKVTYFRLLVLLAYPLKDGTRGTSILKLLIAMTSYMPVQIQEVLSAVLPKLLTHLVENNDQVFT